MTIRILKSEYFDDFKESDQKQIITDVYHEVIDQLMDGTLKRNDLITVDRKSHSIAVEQFMVKTFYLNKHYTNAFVILEYFGGAS